MPSESPASVPLCADLSSTDPVENVGLLLRNVREGLMRRLQKDLADGAVGLNPSQFMVLKHLALHGRATPSELAKALSHDAGAMTRMVDCLERHGYAQREASTEDRRVVYVAITTTGQSTWNRMASKLTEVLAQALGVLTPDERHHLVDLLTRVQTSLDTLSE